MTLKGAIFGDEGDDYLTDYTKKRMKEEAAKKTKNKAKSLKRPMEPSSRAGKRP